MGSHKKDEAQVLFKEECHYQTEKGDEAVKLKDYRALLARFLIIQLSRPDLVPKLENTIGHYKMALVPRSFVFWGWISSYSYR